MNRLKNKLPINVLSVVNIKDKYNKLFIYNFINHSAFTNAYSINMLRANQFFTYYRSRVSLQFKSGFFNFHYLFQCHLSQLLLRSLFNNNFVHKQNYASTLFCLLFFKVAKKEDASFPVSFLRLNTFFKSSISCFKVMYSSFGIRIYFFCSMVNEGYFISNFYKVKVQ